MRMKKELLIYALGAIALAGCSSNEPVSGPVIEDFSKTITVAESRASECMGAFEANFFAEAAAMSCGNENMVISPLGVSMYLSMVANCVDATSAAEIAGILGGADVEACNSLASRYLTWLPVADDNVKITFANALWYRSNRNLNSEFSAVASETYNTDIFANDFSNNANLRNLIKDWVSKKTDNNIPDVALNVPANRAAFLANAVTFKGGWTQPFKASETKNETFHGSKSDTQVATMHKESFIDYSAGENYQAARLPFGSNRFAMVCVLPAENSSLKDVCAKAPGVLKAQFSRKHVSMALPKFKITPDNQISITEVLQAMGLQNTMLFDAIYTEKTGEVVDIVQSTAFEISEDGVSASSVTINNMASAPELETPIDMVFNRPFIFFVVENTTGLTLFAGRIEQL